MPTSMLPAGIQYLTMFFPGAYSAGLFRTYFMSRPLEYTTSMLMDVSTPGNPYYNPNYAKVLDSFDGTFPMSMKFFQYDVTPMMMAIVLLIFIAIFVVLNLTITPGNIISAQNFKPKKKGPRIPKK